MVSLMIRPSIQPIQVSSHCRLEIKFVQYRRLHIHLQDRICMYRVTWVDTQECITEYLFLQMALISYSTSKWMESFIMIKSLIMWMSA